MQDEFVLFCYMLEHEKRLTYLITKTIIMKDVYFSVI